MQKRSFLVSGKVWNKGHQDRVNRKKNADAVQAAHLVDLLARGLVGQHPQVRLLAIWF